MQTRPQVTISEQTCEGYWVTLLARPWLTMTAGKRPAPRGLNRMPCRSYAMPATVARYVQVPPDTDSALPISVNPAGKPGVGGDGAAGDFVAHAAVARITNSRAARVHFTIPLYSGERRFESLLGELTCQPTSLRVKARSGSGNRLGGAKRSFAAYQCIRDK